MFSVMTIAQKWTANIILEMSHYVQLASISLSISIHPSIHPFIHPSIYIYIYILDVQYIPLSGNLRLGIATSVTATKIWQLVKWGPPGRGQGKHGRTIDE
jgi:hypothetical protein